MRDHDIRQQLGRDLRRWHAEHGTLFIDEFDLGGLVRVDVAAINGALWGYEIKSHLDTLRRLPTQIEIYSKVFDYAALVVAERHYDHALELLPDWWKIYVARSDSPGNLDLVMTHEGNRNPSVDPWQLVQLLWRDETLNELTARNLDRGIRSKPRHILWDRLATSVPLEELQMIVRSRLKSRQKWRDCS